MARAGNELHVVSSYTNFFGFVFDVSKMKVKCLHNHCICGNAPGNLKVALPNWPMLGIILNQFVYSIFISNVSLIKVYYLNISNRIFLTAQEAFELGLVMLLSEKILRFLEDFLKGTINLPLVHIKAFLLH